MFPTALHRSISRSWIRYPCRRCYSTFDDMKLQQIIETSNMGMSLQLEKQKREIDSKKKSAIVSKIEHDYRNAQREMCERIRRGFVGNSLSLSADELEQAEHAEKETEFSQRLQNKLSDLRATLTSATKALNDLTGYTAIDKLKKAVELLEGQLKTTKSDLKLAKSAYTDAIQRRSDLQQEINELLTRKHNWTAIDLERFTELYRNDHQIQNEEKAAELALEDAELAVDAVQVKLTQLILTRYHEEQIWSDKIRQVSTWGTWMLMGVNVMLFAIATFFVEPWKRRRLVDAFHNEVEQKLDEFSLEIQQLSEKFGNSQLPSIPDENLQDKKPSSVSEVSDVLPDGNYVLSFASIKTWTSFKLWVQSTVYAIRDPNTLSYRMERIDLGIFSALLVAVGGSLGAALTYVIVGK